MQPTLILHIVAGSLALLSGFVALYASKGAPLHRQAGMVFVVVMLTMCLTGTVVAAVRGAAPAVNIPAAIMTAYFVVTGLTAVRPPFLGSRAVAIVGLLVAGSVGMVDLYFGYEAIRNGGSREGIPAFPFFLFGIFGLLASASDARMLREGGVVRGATRIARHLWRMSFALLIAAMSFFFGQADELPKALRIPALLAAPVLAVLVTMLYWLWRVRFRRSLRGLAVLRAPEAV